AIGRYSLQPGWRWSQDIAPIVRTRSYQNYAISGSLQVTMDDGTELAIRSGDAYELPPGHEVLVLGDERWESVEFASGHTFGLAPEELGERVLATVLFSDIVDSTRMLERLGDHAWASVLRAHNERSERRSIASAAERWPPQATAFSRSLMAPQRRSAPGRPWIRRSRNSGSAFASVSTRARSKSSAASREASAFT